ncbi:aldose 1-epimerase family protein [Alsobacter sp. KACC 23698]|uniref:Aldose 1-epimerase family protein n=1 Tax=Alsobacter sp. KACC 23698 TaxID=3149229 RepID=A0AAU7JJ01_9HYPH
MIILEDARLRAAISPHGAELQSLTPAGGEDVMWGAGPEWPRHSPLLFPIVGRLEGEALLHEGRVHRMPKHGFARDSAFHVAARDRASCILELRDTPATRALYPFAFTLTLTYRIQDGALTIDYAVANPGTEPLPFSLGAHPAFRWPLGDAPKTAHALTFEREETAPVRRLVGEKLGPGRPTPVEGRTLWLREDLFADDALVFDQVDSRSVTYGAPGGPWVRVSWSGFRELGVWMKPGADFLCIEPWRGYDTPVEFDGPFVDKPGVMTLAPGDAARFALTIAPSPAA